MKPTLYALALLGLLASAHPVFSQTVQMPPTMETLLRGDQAPLTHKLGDLDGTWRRLSLGNSSDSGNPAQAYLSLFSGGGMGDVYYTQGQTAAVGSETYLIAYHRQTPPFDFAALIRAGNSATPPKPIPLTPDTVLSLSLLNLRTAGSLNDIRPFDLQQEIAASRQTAAQMEDMGVGDTTAPQVVTLPAEDQSASQTSVRNLKQLSLGLLEYAQDWDETLPPMNDAATVKKTLLPYVKSEQIFLQPETHRPYKANTSLSKRTLASFKDPATMVVFYEDAPDKDNTHAVAFLDGHVKRIPESQWPALKAASHVPGP